MLIIAASLAQAARPWCRANQGYFRSVITTSSTNTSGVTWMLNVFGASTLGSGNSASNFTQCLDRDQDFLFQVYDSNYNSLTKTGFVTGIQVYIDEVLLWSVDNVDDEIDYVFSLVPVTASPTLAPSTNPSAAPTITLCPPDKATFFVDISPDSNPNEVSWALYKLGGGGFVHGETNGASRRLCLEDGTYAFNIADTGNNGLCCLNGNGSYAVTVGSDLVKQNGEYESHDSFTFIIKNHVLYLPTASPTTQPSFAPSRSPSAAPSTSPSRAPSANPSSTPSANPSANPTSTPFANPTANPSSNPSAAPSVNPSAAPTPWDFSCASTEQLLNIDIDYDNRPEETSWVLYKYQSNKLSVVDEGNSSSWMCLEFGQYMWVIADQGNDGMCSHHGTGSYSLSVDGSVVSHGCDFGDIDIVWFNSSSHTYPELKKPKCGRYDEFITVNIDPDLIPFQVSWKINKIGYNTALYTGSYSESRIVCLPPGDYVFTIGDQGCDGLDSTGSFNVSHEGVILLNGADFGCSFSGVFTVDNLLHYPSASPSAYPSANPSANPSSNPSANPSAAPTAFDFPAFDPCPYDKWSLQLVFSNSDGKTLQYSFNSVYGGSAHETVLNKTLSSTYYNHPPEKFCLPGGTYLFQIFGDDVCYVLGRKGAIISKGCVSEQDVQLFTLPDKSASTKAPTTFNFGHCDSSDEYFVEVDITPGTDTTETTWLVKKKDLSSPLIEKDGSQSGYVCVTAGYYVFSISDSGDNGMGHGGSFKVSVGDVVVISNQNFTSSFSQVFYVGATQAPVSSPTAAPSAAPTVYDPTVSGESTSCSQCRNKCRQFMATALSCSSTSCTCNYPGSGLSPVCYASSRSMLSNYNISVTSQTFDYDTMVATASNWVTIASALSTSSYHECLQLPGPASQCLLYYNNAGTQCKNLGIESCDWVIGFDSKPSPSYSWPYCMPSLCTDEDYSWFIGSASHTVEVYENCTSVSGGSGSLDNAGAHVSVSLLYVLLLVFLVVLL